VIPASIDTDDFRAAWTLWQQHRTEKRSSLTKTGGTQQLAKLAAMGEARAVAALTHSMVQGWTGVFEPDARDVAATGPSQREVELARYREVDP
jgi:hypothetical protein